MLDIYPIWNKLQVAIPGSTGLDAAFFRVYIDTPSDNPFSGAEVLVFEGRAVQRPNDSGVIYTSVNDIVADYLNAAIDAQVVALFYNASGTEHWDALALAVRIDGSADGLSWTIGTPFIFAPDWSYDAAISYPNTATPIILNAPIRAELTLDSVLVPTVIYQNGEPIDVTAKENGVTVDTLQIAYPGSGAAAFALPDYTLTAGRVLTFEAADGDTATGPSYTLLPSCAARYELIYVNLYGGIDTLLVKGPVTRSEGYDRQTAGRVADASYDSDAYARTEHIYRNDIAERWTLHLGGTFTADQAARMRHLVGSTHIWLRDIVNGVLTPITIDDADCIDKTFRNQGRQRVTYTLTAHTAQERIRR